MKVKMLTRNPDDYLRETKHDIHKLPRNYDPALHPLETPREYTRALNAVKLERVFAKPFICSLSGHRDGVSLLVKHPKQLSWLLSGSYGGELKLWDVSHRKQLRSVQAHNGYVRGLCFTENLQGILTVGDDKLIKQWSCKVSEDSSEWTEPQNTIISKTILTGISHHRKKPLFATCGEACQLWEETRAEPIQTYQWGVASLSSVRFNPVEVNMLGTCASDRSIMLYDVRNSGPVRKVVLKMRSNSLCWNPMEAFVFTVANEDFNLYSFDIRKLNFPLNVHMDHTSAVLDLDYSPTGKEFVAGSYDKTIRIFPVDQGHSRDVYHTKRMQRLSCVAWSGDDKYVFSGSDEMNIRMWKARASEKMGVVKDRERRALEVDAKLKEKFSQHPAVKRIARHRHVPKHVLNAKRQIEASRESSRRKEANRRAHSRPGTVPFVPERQRPVVGEHE
nr:EOG090X04WU [Triops cancriformis]